MRETESRACSQADRSKKGLSNPAGDWKRTMSPRFGPAAWKRSHVIGLETQAQFYQGRKGAFGTATRPFSLVSFRSPKGRFGSRPRPEHRSLPARSHRQSEGQEYRVAMMGPN